MKKYNVLSIALLSSVLFISNTSNAATIDFNTLTSGSTSFSFDGDGDFIDDVIFSTTDPLGFNTVGPGSNQSFINEPGLEGTTLLSPDLRVDFLNGAVTNLSFGFAVDNSQDGVDGVTFSIFDSSDALLNLTTQLGYYTLPDGVNSSSFPEGFVDLSFLGIASYAIFDFSNNSAPRYIIDNLTGTFGSTEDISPIPVPAAAWLFGSALLGFFGFSRKKANA